MGFGGTLDLQKPISFLDNSWYLAKLPGSANVYFVFVSMSGKLASQQI